MFRPLRLVVEAHAPQFAAHEELAQRRDRVIDGERRDQWAVLAHAMPAPPRHEARHAVVINVGDEHGLAKKFQHDVKQRPRVCRAGEILRVLGPVAPSDIVELERRARGLGLRDQRPCSLAFDALYGFGFALLGLFCRAEKANTFDLEIVLVERRSWVASDGHGESFRVWLAMN
jgi:hypothetical protein